MKLKKLDAITILDSRGFPTIECYATLESGHYGVASVPSGSSTGSLEAFELRDFNQDYCLGKGVLRAVNNIKTVLNDQMCGLEVSDHKEVDKIINQIDNTINKSFLGANATLATSLAISDAVAKARNLSFYENLSNNTNYTLPCPMMNIINGGKHANNNLGIQEFMIMPTGYDSFEEAIIASATVYHNLKSILIEKNLSTNIGDEGGFAPNISSINLAIEYIIKAIEKSGYKPGEHFLLALDCAASEFYQSDTKLYNLGDSTKELLSPDELLQYYAMIAKKYPIFSIEDAFAESDWDGFQKITQRLSKNLQIVGDDIFVTNPKILRKGIENNIANAILIKPNQIGTLSETIETFELAKINNYNTIISHRSGETEDNKIAHIAVGLNSGQIKTGAPCRTDRNCKYNEILRISRKLEQAEYCGRDILKKFQSFSDK